jgi:hypothetical protein
MRFCALYLPNLCQENVVFNFDLTQTVMEISLFLFKKKYFTAYIVFANYVITVF